MIIINNILGLFIVPRGIHSKEVNRSWIRILSAREVSISLLLPRKTTKRKSWCMKKKTYRMHMMKILLALLTQRDLYPAMLVSHIPQVVHSYATKLQLHSANGKEMASKDHTLLLSCLDRCSWFDHFFSWLQPLQNHWPTSARPEF